MIDLAQLFLAKAEESLEGAESELTNRRYNNCANRCYFSVFQAAISALIRAGMLSPRGEWGHAFVHARLVGELVNRRKVYPAALRGTLHDNMVLRLWADYEDRQVSAVQATRAVRRTGEFVSAIR